MSTKNNILVAFVLNLGFSIFELFGGLFTNSISIISDAVHDFGDALSIGIAFFLEKKSARAPDETYTYGYRRYSVLGAFITTVILLIGSTLVIVGSIYRIIHPEPVNYTGMLVFASVGVVVNSLAAYKTHGGGSLNQKSVNLHMLEDVLGWVVVLIGAILMQFTDISLIDPIISLGVASFIAIHALLNFRSILDLFLEKTPQGISIHELEDKFRALPGVEGVHHLHIWSIDGEHNYATAHIVTSDKITIPNSKTSVQKSAKNSNIMALESSHLKSQLREVAKKCGIGHITIELEHPDEDCGEKECHPESSSASIDGHTHHHSHHH